VAGIVLFGSEVQHGTLGLALSAQPNRWLHAASKTAMAAAFGLVLGAVGMITGYVGAVLGGLELGNTSGMVATTAWALFFTTVSAMLGLGVGMIVRHAAGAISGLLVWWLVLENLLWAFLPARISRFLPYFAGGSLLDVDVDMNTTETLAAAFTRPQAALVYAAYAGLALVVGTVLLHRRDTN
jgi:ABC-2 type transport system permease protein